MLPDARSEGQYVEIFIEAQPEGEDWCEAKIKAQLGVQKYTFMWLYLGVSIAIRKLNKLKCNALTQNVLGRLEGR